jgi:hypothetical protein
MDEKNFVFQLLALTVARSWAAPSKEQPIWPPFAASITVRKAMPPSPSPLAMLDKTFFRAAVLDFCFFVLYNHSLGTQNFLHH